MVGHIKLERKILSWEWYTDHKTFHLFLYLLLKANHKEGQWRGQYVQRGQLIFGRQKASADTGLSENEIRTSISKLKSTNEISVKTTNKYSIITICKYDHYQTSEKKDNQQDNQQSNQQTTSKPPAINQQITTNKNGKNEKNENNEEGLETDNFWFDKPLFQDYSLYKAQFNGRSASEDHFTQWRSFIKFLRDNGYTKIFKGQFVNPQDFGILITRDKFTSEKWDVVVNKILGTGVKPEHEMYFRIPQFMKYVEEKNTNHSDIRQQTKTTKINLK